MSDCQQGDSRDRAGTVLIRLKASTIYKYVEANPDRGLAQSMLVCAFIVGMTSGYYCYAGDISSGNPFLISFWYVLLPVGALVVSWRRNRLFDGLGIILLVSPFLALPGFWLVYRHPDLWNAGILAAVKSAILCAAVFYASRFVMGKKPEWDKRITDGTIHLFVPIVMGAYAVVALLLLLIPLDVNYVPKALHFRGEGLMNGADNDVQVIHSNTVFYADSALYGDLMVYLKEQGGYSGLTALLSDTPSRKSLGGPLLYILPIQDHGIPD